MIELLDRYKIKYQDRGSKHCRQGWVNMVCPFCVGNPGLHLGMHIASGTFNCWRCGFHPTTSVVCALLNIDKQTARTLINKYGRVSYKSIPTPEIRIKPFRLPTAVTSLTQPHKKYLESRGFDPEYIEKTWELKSTSPTSILDKAEYKYRILAPVYWENRMVSFQARDVTGKSKLKYKACTKEREHIHHKHILYGKPEKLGGTGIIVEGITDVWRLGESSFALFGIGFTTKQILILYKTFEKVFIVFDEDPQALQKGKELTWELRGLGMKAEQIIIPGDPGSMVQEEANELVKSCTTNFF